MRITNYASGEETPKIKEQGIQNALRDGVTRTKTWTASDFAKAKKEFLSHVEALATAFNTASKLLGLGVRLSTRRLKMEVEVNPAIITTYFDGSDRGGRIYENQIRTAVDAIKFLIENPEMSLLILGALQSGKTGTSNALHFFGPINYLITGRKVFPIYLVTSLTSHEEQTKDELTRFLLFYGSLEFKFEKKTCTLAAFLAPSVAEDDFLFANQPSLKTYRDHVLQNANEDEYQAIKVDDMVKRRVHGKGLRELAETAARLKARGYDPLYVLDEVQHGASDRTVLNLTTGKTETRPCVLKQLLTNIHEALDEKARFICLSATPFDTSDMSQLGKIFQYLPSNYVGFNMFKGMKIDHTVTITPPKVLNYAEMGKQIGVPELKWVNMAFYNIIVIDRCDPRDDRVTTRSFKPRSFEKWAREVGYNIGGGTWFDKMDRYMAFVEKTLRKTLDVLVRTNGGKAKDGRPLGVVVRAVNDNSITRHLIRKIGFNRDVAQPLAFDNNSEGSVKQFIQRTHDGQKPVVMFVTSKARMGDAFPVNFEVFLDFAQKAGDLNALLQGLLGRACGVGKNSTVVLSEQNTDTVRLYIKEDGLVRGKGSRHAINIGTKATKARKMSAWKVFHDPNDPVIDGFFDYVNRELVDKYVMPSTGSGKVVTKRSRGGPRFTPFFGAANPVFDHIEATQGAKYRNLLGKIEIARNGDIVGGKGFHLSDADPLACEVIFRRGDKIGGNAGRGKGQRDGSAQSERGQTRKHLMPQINLKLVNGKWRAFMVVMALKSPVTDVGPAASRALPADGNPMRDSIIGPGLTDAEMEEVLAAEADNA